MNKRWIPFLFLLIAGCVGGCAIGGAGRPGGVQSTEITLDPTESTAETAEGTTSPSTVGIEITESGVSGNSADPTSAATTGPDADKMWISRIDVRHSSFGRTESEYRIDLKTRSFLLFIPFENIDAYAPRDPEAENEGFTTASDLSERDVNAFLLQCTLHGFGNWKEHYENHDICDGHQWSMVITFADGTMKEIFGSNEYPDSWDKMRIAFRELTGIDVLAVSSDWLDG